MININDYMTEEQKSLVDQIQAQDDYYYINTSGYEAELNRKKTRDDLECYKAHVVKTGMGALTTRQEIIARDIMRKQAELNKIQEELNRLQDINKLLSRLEDTQFNSIVDRMCEDREKEINNMELVPYHRVYKEINYSLKGYTLVNPKTVIVIEDYLMEKGNCSNIYSRGPKTTLDWSERGTLVEKLKELGAVNIRIDESLLTKKIQNQFNIM